MVVFPVDILICVKDLADENHEVKMQSIFFGLFIATPFVFVCTFFT